MKRANNISLMTAFYFVATVLHLVLGQFPVRPIFNANSYTGSEGGTIVGNLVISGLSGEGSLRSGSLVYKIEAFKGINDRGLATYDVDYAFQSGQNFTEVIFSPRKDSSSSFTINLHKDDLHEGDENFFLRFQFKAATGDFNGVFQYQDSATNFQQECTISDDDVVVCVMDPLPAKVSCENDRYCQVVDESTLNSVVITSHCMGRFERSITIEVNCQGVSTSDVIAAATADKDFMFSSFSFTYLPSSSIISRATQELVVPILNDNIPEQLEQFVCDLLLGAGALVSTENQRITVNIDDDDGCPFGDVLVTGSSLETFTRIHTNKFIAPLTPTSESLNKFKPTTFVCYQVKSVSHNFVNLFSSSCLSVNAQFILRAGQFYMSSVGIVIGGSNGQCTHVSVASNSHDCQVTVNRKLIPSSNSSRSNGSPIIEINTVSPRVTMVTISSRMDDSTRVVAKVKCTWNPYLKTSVLDLYILNSLSLPNSHGLLGQLWNAQATVISPECEDFVLFSSLPFYKVLLPDRRTIPVIHRTRQWDRDGSCLHASLEGPSVIEGTPADYTVSNLLATEYKYSKFSTICV